MSNKAHLHLPYDPAQDAPAPVWLRLKIAAECFGFVSVKSLQTWLDRHNLRYPEAAVRRVHGRVHRADLEAALDWVARQQTPALKIGRAASEIMTGGRSR